MPDPWRQQRQGAPPVRRFLPERSPCSLLRGIAHYCALKKGLGHQAPPRTAAAGPAASGQPRVAAQAPPGLPVPPAGEAKYVRAAQHGRQGFSESRVTEHETRLFIGSPCGDKAELKMAEPETEFRRPHPRARRQATTSLRRVTGPFRDILGLLWPDNGFLPNDTDSRNRLLPQFVGICRYMSGPPPSRCPRAVHRSQPASRRASFAGKSRKCAQNPVYRRKMREAQRSPRLPSHFGLGPLQADSE